MNFRELHGLSHIHFPLVFLTTKICRTETNQQASEPKDQGVTNGSALTKNQGTVANTDGRTPLHLASTDGNLDDVKSLVALQPEGAGRRNFIDKKDEDGATSLSLAVRNGHSDVVKYLIDEYADLGYLDYLVRLAVCNAKSGDKIVKMLLSAVPESARAQYVNAADDKGNTAIHWACLKGNLESVNVLLKAGGMVASANKHGQTPLMAAVWSDKNDILELLRRNMGREGVLNYINRKQADSETTLEIATRKGCLDDIENTVKARVYSLPSIAADIYTAEADVVDGARKVTSKVSVKTKESEFPETKIANCVHAEDSEGNTALHWASWKGNLEAVDLIFKAGGKLFHQNDKGETPLLLAASKGHLNVLKYLIDVIGSEGITKKHYVNVKRKNDETALMIAVQEGHAEVARYLLDISESDVGEIDELLRFAAENNKSDARVVEVVLAAIPEAGRAKCVNTVDGDGNTALHLAALEGVVDAIDMLVEAGGKIVKTNGQGKTPVMLAAMEGHEDAVTFILDKYYEVRKCYDYE